MSYADCGLRVRNRFILERKDTFGSCWYEEQIGK